MRYIQERSIDFAHSLRYKSSRGIYGCASRVLEAAMVGHNRNMDNLPQRGNTENSRLEQPTEQVVPINHKFAGFMRFVDVASLL